MKHQRLRGDVVVNEKIMKDIDGEGSLLPQVEMSNTCGHRFKVGGRM